MQQTSETTVAEADITRAQLRIPKSIWDRIKIQAIREEMTAEQLGAKAFEEYLASKQG